MKRMLTMIAVLAALAAVFGCAPSSPAEMDSITVAIAPFESVGLVYVADDRKLFADQGLQVTYREYKTGVAALEGVQNGEADLAVGTSEYPLVRKAFEGEPVSAVACIDRPDFIYVVGRKDRGIEGASDLAGKRVGTVVGSIAEFYLGRFLELNDVATDTVTLVDLKTPEEWRQAISVGDVDAVVLAQPEASLVRGLLRRNATFFSVQEGQPTYTLVISTNDWIARSPGPLGKFLAALADAEEFVGGSPAEARAIIQERLGLDPGYMDQVETQNTFMLSLDQSLITAMEDEARWMIKNRITPKTEMPDFLAHVYTDGLEHVKPETVNIVR